MKAGPYRETLTAERIRGFAKSVCAQTRAVVPPTLLTICRRGEFELFGKLGFKLSQVLHAEQEYVYEKAIPANGDLNLSYETTLAQAFEKKGASGSMKFFVFETRVENIGTTRTTVIVKESA